MPAHAFSALRVAAVLCMHLTWTGHRGTCTGAQYSNNANADQPLGGRASRTILESCSINKFAKQLSKIAIPGRGYARPGVTLLPKTVYHRRTLKRYKNITVGMPGAICKGTADPEWPPSRRTGKAPPLIINAGEGTTATRFMACVFRQLGMVSSHNGGKHEFKGCNPGKSTDRYNASCTHAWDQYEYITDSPVQYQLYPLLQTHPKALVLLSLRDPDQWQAKRIGTHKHKGSAEWRQAAPCGASVHPMSDPNTPLDFAIYNAWVSCVVPEGRLFPYNLFNETTKNVLYRLYRFLRNTHGVKFPANKTVTWVRAACGDMAWPTKTPTRVEQVQQRFAELTGGHASGSCGGWPGWIEFFIIFGLGALLGRYTYSRRIRCEF